MSENNLPVSVSVFRGTPKNISRKDLRNCLKLLNTILKPKRHPRREENVLKEEIITKKVSELVSKNQPIRYYYHKTGAGNRRGGYVGKTPVKCYKYLYDFLKGHKDKFKNLVMKRFYIEGVSSRIAGGYRRSSRGRAVLSDRRRYRVALTCYHPPTLA